MPATESSAPDNVAVVGVPADGQLVAEHFSRASFFVLTKVSPGRVRDVRIVAFPARGKGSPAIFLAGLGVNLVLACEIGERPRPGGKLNPAASHYGVGFNRLR